jgi:NADH:ubiquinone oxidoreductase subunit 5 (subunit L)/multisubunit Na+/H+ antiporter MnhA subunit
LEKTQTEVEWIQMTITKGTKKYLVILVVLGGFGLFLIGSGINFMLKDLLGFSFATIGIGCFLFLLALMSYLTYCLIPPVKEERRKSLLILDRKEIRRSLALSFTVLFILLIAFYFLTAESFAPQSPDANTTTLAVGKLTGLSQIITAFATIYVVIIGFYFGSRIYEKIKEIKNAEETLKFHYIMDEIEVADFREKMKVLRGLKTKLQLEVKAIKRSIK